MEKWLKSVTKKPTEDDIKWAKDIISHLPHQDTSKTECWDIYLTEMGIGLKERNLILKRISTKESVSDRWNLTEKEKEFINNYLDRDNSRERLSTKELGVKQGLDYDELERKFDKFLDKESPEGFRKWLNEEHNKELGKKEEENEEKMSANDLHKMFPHRPMSTVYNREQDSKMDEFYKSNKDKFITPHQ